MYFSPTNGHNRIASLVPVNRIAPMARRNHSLGQPSPLGFWDSLAMQVIQTFGLQASVEDVKLWLQIGAGALGLILFMKLLKRR